MLLELQPKRVFAAARYGGSGAPLQLHVVLGSAQSSDGEVAWLILSALTAYVVPVRREIVYQLEVEGELERTAVQAVSLRGHAGPLARPPSHAALPFKPWSKQTQVEIIDNMEATFLADLARDLATPPAE